MADHVIYTTNGGFKLSDLNTGDQLNWTCLTNGAVGWRILNNHKNIEELDVAGLFNKAEQVLSWDYAANYLNSLSGLSYKIAKAPTNPIVALPSGTTVAIRQIQTAMQQEYDKIFKPKLMEHLCICEMRDLMMHGCKCGQMARERKGA
jgi:hypothetical protein